MTDQRKVQLGVAVDATGAKAGFDQVKAGAKDMAQAVAAAGQQGAKGLDGIGAGGTEAASKLDKNTRSMIGSVQRATAAMQAGERGSAKYFETLAQQRGVSSDVLKPYIDQLRQAEAAQAAAQGSLGKMGISAKQTAAAMRGVPAQFTDIFTSIQGGQAPLTVLLQQGGQLKDMFGGAGAAAKALGGYVLGLVSPFTVAAAAVGGLAYGYLMGAKESDNHTRALIQSGNAAGTTANQMSAAAQRIGAMVGTQGQAAAALDAMAQSGAVGASNLERFTVAAVQFERVTGTAIDDTVKSFAELKKAPLEASLKLNESMNYLTASLYTQIKALDEQGRSTEAADLAQRAFADTISTRAGEMEKQLGVVERSWRNIKDAVLGAGDALLSVGRKGTVQDELARVQNMISAKSSGLPSYAGTSAAEGTQREIEQLRVIEASLQERIRLEGRSASITAERASLVKLLAGYEKEQEQYKTKAQRRDEEIQRTQIEGARLVSAGLLSQKQLELDIANIREKYADKADKNKGGDPFAADRAAAQEWAQYFEAFTSLTDKATGKTLELSAAQLKLQQYLVSPAYATATEEMRQLVLQQAYGAVSAEQLATAQAALAKSQAEFGNARDAELKRTGAEIVALENRAQALEDEVQAYGLGKAAVEAMTIARLEERKAILQQFDGSEQQIQLLEQEIAARKRLAAAQDSLSGQQASEKAAKKAVEDWQRAADKIESSITDALMRGFESGKSFAENMRDVVVNMFKTMVLRPVISAVVNPVAGALTGSLGLSGTANAASTVGGIGNAANAASAFSIGGLGNPFTNIGGFMGNGVADFGGFLVDKGFTSMGTSLESFGLSMKANEAAINGVGDALGYLNSAVLASEGKWGAAVGSAIGTYFGGPIGAAIGQAVGGWVDEAFGGGREYTTGSGISGTFSNSGFSGRNYQDWRNDGSSGFFGLGASGSSSGTNYSALDASTAKGLGTAFASVQAQTAGFAGALGLSADTIMGFSKDVRVTLGSDAEANKKALQDLLTGIADDLAKTVLDTQYMRESETAASTLARLATNLSTVNSLFGTLGKSTLTISQAGGDSASQLVDLLGGLEQFNSTTLSYYQTFYTEAERNAKTTEQLVAQFAGLGVAVPDSLQAYRDLVNAQDISTASGREMYASLMGLSGAFATVTDAAQKAVQDLIKTSDYATYIDYASAVSKAGGTPVPRFAGGGDHTGGLRVIGERGWEVEATGPARIWNQQQLGAALSGGGAATAEEVAALREEQRAQSAAMVSRLVDLVEIVKKWEGIGMPEVRTT